MVVTSERPRLSVQRSLKHIRGQIIGLNGKVIASASDEHITDAKVRGVKRAFETGKLLAERARGKEVTAVVFDKAHYKYHGRVKAFADGAREGGLSF